MTSIQAAKQKIKRFFVFEGGHSDREDGMCAMEWAAYLAGRPHSDTPVCVAHDIRAMMISVNDNTDDKTRQKLRGLIPRSLKTQKTKPERHPVWGPTTVAAPTKADAAAVKRRRIKRIDAFYRTLLPLLLDATKHEKEANALRAMSPLKTENPTKAMLAVIDGLKLNQGVGLGKELNTFWYVVEDLYKIHFDEFEIVIPLLAQMTKTKRKEVEKAVLNGVFDLLDELLPPLNPELKDNELVTSFLAHA